MRQIDKDGFRPNVGIVLINRHEQVFWGKRIGYDHWQFPQGGIQGNEQPEQALFRELQEEIGLDCNDVKIISTIPRWLRYRLPRHLIRHYRKPVCVGQKQKWFLLKLIAPEQKIRLDLSPKPEFDSWRWVHYWHPMEEVITFKHHVYEQVLKEFEHLVLQSKEPDHNATISTSNPTNEDNKSAC